MRYFLPAFFVLMLLGCVTTNDVDELVLVGGMTRIVGRTSDSTFSSMQGNDETVPSNLHTKVMKKISNPKPAPWPNPAGESPIAVLACPGRYQGCKSVWTYSGGFGIANDL